MNKKMRRSVAFFLCFEKIIQGCQTDFYIIQGISEREFTISDDGVYEVYEHLIKYSI